MPFSRSSVLAATVAACLVVQVVSPTAPAEATPTHATAHRAPVPAHGAAPVVRSVSPTTIHVGGSVTVAGSNFNPVKADDQARIGTVDATVLAASATRLVLKAPPGTGGSVRVTTRWGHATGSTVTITGVPSTTAGSGGKDEHPLTAPAGVTALAGQVQTAAGRPLGGVRLTVTDHKGRSVTATTRPDGQYLVSGATTGASTLRIDGTHANGGDYGVYQEPVSLAAGRTTVLPWLTYLTRIDDANGVTIPSPTTTTVTLTSPQIPGLRIVIPAGTVITTSTGQVVRRLTLTALPTDRTPMPWGPSMVPTYFTIQPGDAHVSGPGLKVVYPNGTRLPAGSKVTYLAEGPDWPGTGWWAYGSGHVTADGTSIVPDAGTSYDSTGPGGFATDGGPDTGATPGNSCACGDPVDLRTGLLADSATDISLPDIQGTTFARVFRQNDYTVRDFGIGGSDSLNIYITVDLSGNFDLYQPDGGKITFTPTATTGVYDAGLTPTQYAGSVLTMGDDGDTFGPFTLALTNGTTMTFGDPAFLSSITDRFGNTLTVNRVPFEDAVEGGGQITSVVTSDGRWLDFTYGACVSGSATGCVTQIVDNAGRAVSYAYDPSGRLLTVTDVGGGVTTNTWAPCTSALTCTQLDSTTDPAGRTTTYTYDPATGTITQEKLPTGGIWTFHYGTDSAGNAQTIATNPVGKQIATSFNAQGNPIVAVDGYGSATSRTTTIAYWNGTGLPATVVDPLGRTTATTYDPLGNPLTVTKLAGTSEATTTTYTYEPKYSRVASVTDPLGNTSTTTYDDSTGVVTTTDALGASTITRLNNEGQAVVVTDADGHTTYYSYYAGDLVATADPLGNVLTTYYDSLGRPLDITDAEGNTTAYSYDAFGDRLTATDPLGAVTTWTYDADHEITSIANPDGAVTAYTYDAGGQKLTSTNPLGAATRWTYSLTGEVLTVTDPDGALTTDTYDIFGDLLTQTDSFHSYSARTLYAYDAAGRRYCEVDPSQAADGVTCPATTPSTSSPPAGVTSTFHNGLDQVVQVTDPTGATTLSAYDALGHQTCTVGPLEAANGVTCPAALTLTTSQDPEPGAGLTAYDALGHPRIRYNPLGGLTTTTYDAVGNPTSWTVASDNAVNAPPVTTAYSYDADNRTISTTTGSGATASTVVEAYDPDGRVYCAVSPRGHAAGDTCPAWQPSWATTPPNPLSLYSPTAKNQAATSFRDPNGRVIQSSSADGATTIAAYDPAGNRYCQTDPVSLNPWLAASANAGAAYPYLCPATAPTTAPAAGSDPGYQTLIRDAAGEVTSSTDALGDTTTATYDPDGHILTTTAPDGGTTTDCYYWQTTGCAASAPANGGDAAMRYTATLPASSADPNGQTTSYTYSPGGKPSTLTTAAGTQTLTYDADQRTTSASYSTAPAGYTQTAPVSLSYWPDGTPRTVTDGTGTTQYTDNAAGAPLSVSFNPAAGTDATAYTIGYTWYANGQLASLTYPNIGSLAAGTVDYAYNPSGQMSSLTDWNGRTTRFGYDLDGNLAATALPNGVTTTTTYDIADTPTSVTAASSTGALLSIAYAPTSADLIGGETDTGATTSSATYTLDTAGRITQTGSSALAYNADNSPTTLGVQAQTFNAADQLTSSTDGNGQATSYAYDTLGDRISQTPPSGAATTYGYDQTGQLTSIGGPTTAALTYNAAGLLATATTPSGTSTFAYDMAAAIPRLLSDGTSDYLYGPNGNLIEQTGAAGTSYATTDAQNTPRLLTSPTGAVVGAFSYGPTGTATMSTGTVTTPIGYTGGYTLPGTSLVYLHHRYYDPATEQFLSIDPQIALTGAAYNYAGDDPANNVDPNGLSFFSGLTCLLGNAIVNHWQAIAVAVALAAVLVLAPTAIGLILETGIPTLIDAALDAAAAALRAAAASAAADGIVAPAAAIVAAAVVVDVAVVAVATVAATTNGGSGPAADAATNAAESAGSGAQAEEATGQAEGTENPIANLSQSDQQSLQTIRDAVDRARAGDADAVKKVLTDSQFKSLQDALRNGDFNRATSIYGQYIEQSVAKDVAADSNITHIGGAGEPDFLVGDSDFEVDVTTESSSAINDHLARGYVDSPDNLVTYPRVTPYEMYKIFNGYF